MRWIPFGNGREIATELPQCDCCKLVEMRAETKSEGAESRCGERKEESPPEKTGQKEEESTENLRVLPRCLFFTIIHHLFTNHHEKRPPRPNHARQANERLNLRAMQSWSECSSARITCNITELAGGVNVLLFEATVDVTIVLLKKII